MKNDLLNQLIESREQLMRLKAIACRMSHERVLIDRKTQLPVAGIVPEIEFQRVGLCDSAKRSKNPACSHTMARYSIENALDILEQCGKYSDWRAEFNDLNNRIHLLDHKKGEAEKHSARIIKRIRETEQTKDRFSMEEPALIKKQIAEIERQHSLFVEKIEKLKNNILAALNSAIKIEENNACSHWGN